jgi:hypothetical protein
MTGEENENIEKISPYFDISFSFGGSDAANHSRAIHYRYFRRHSFGRERRRSGGRDGFFSWGK